ncbi:MAG TPA: sigma-70 family RNA polymerase sigma factor [Actinomycetota bacterium]|nr:sigma-70 family RNA polymerase sigma factor [Actinomycetota bacterium]
MQSRPVAGPYRDVWSLSDESLLAGLASGDAGAATAFVRRFQARVYGLALTIVRDPALAQDVAQETFVRAWRHAAAYDARRGRVATWLLSIARNLAIDVTRMRRQDPIDPGMLAELRIAAPDSDPSEREFPVDETERLRAAVATLPEEQRRALVLAAFYGRTAREIAELERIPIGTAKTRIRASMLKLRAAFEVSSDE